MKIITAQTQQLLEYLGHDEMPFGVFYSDSKPDGYGPKPGEIFTRERELAGRIDWKNAFGNFPCIFGNLLFARKKRTAAWLSHEECGCMGGGYFAGMYAPCLETNVRYVSTGIPGSPIEGEHFLPSPESMHAFMEDCAPPPAPGKYCIFKPLDQFADEETPLIVVFFARPEVLTGLFVLTSYTTGNHHSVVTPFGAGCTNITAWPLVYQRRGIECAVCGGFDPSARKFMNTDELSFAVPLSLYTKMLSHMDKSALTRHTWQQRVRKKVLRSAKTWKKKSASE